MNEHGYPLKKKSSRIDTGSIAITGITAALYMTATLMVAPLSFGAIQFRFAELLILLAFIDSGYAPGLILGCALANLFSPLGIVDVVVGTTATACTLLFVTRSKSLLGATLWPTIFCIFVGAELWIVNGLPFFLTSATVMLGEFVVVTCIGYPCFRLILKNTKLVSMLKIKKS